jgi:hypothetical protein
VNSATDEASLFENGPPLAVQKRLGLVGPGRRNIARRALLVILIGWAPVATLALFKDFGSFVTDAGVHARSLIAAPLFLIAESICAPRLGVLALGFMTGGLIAEEDQERYATAIGSTRRLLESRMAETVVIALAYATVLALALTSLPDMLPAWHRSGTQLAVAYSAAGWWHLLISLPLLLALLFGWMWRLILWTRFLWLMSQLNLRLIPAHPDRAAGLGFTGQSVRVYSAVALPLATVIAGRVANGVIHEGLSLRDQIFFIIGGALLAVVLFAGPLLVFSLQLLDEYRRGVSEYGALARGLGREFERKWFARDRKLNEEILSVQDFSATTDLYQIVANVYAMRFVPVDLKSLMMLVGTTLLPFLPVALLATPLDVLLANLKNLLL